MKTDIDPKNDNDHKILGKKLDLFTFSDVVGKGLPLWTPKGASIRRELERFIVDTELKWGYSHVYTPDLAKLDLYRKSGHYPYYKDSMYAPMQIEDEEFMLRPMTCPHHFELFLSHPRSYKELPIRYAELAKLYRFEQSGELMGLIRTRSFCLADAHIIARETQTEDELNRVFDLIEFTTKTLGLIKDKDYHYRLSLGDRENDKKYYKDDEAWDKAENILRETLKKRGDKFVEAKAEAAFYGPKVDIQMVNANGKEDTAFTVQYDFVFPKRFNLNYINEKGEEEQSVVIHRSSIGAVERIVAFLIEKYEGAFPVWLSPVQVKVLPIAERHLEFARKIEKTLRDQGIRIEVDERGETLQAKIRDAQMEKVPYMIILGDKELESKNISVRLRDGSNLNAIEIEEFIERTKNKIASKELEI